MLRIICQLFGLNEALRWYHFWHIKHEPLQVTQYWWSIGGRKIVRYKHLSVPVLWCWFLRRSEQLASVLITFLGFVTKYLMRSNLREERFALAYSLRVMVHQGREAVVLREWGGWSHWPCNQEAEGRLAVASLPNTKTPPPSSAPQLSQRGTTSPWFHNLPKYCHWMETICPNTGVWRYFNCNHLPAFLSVCSP